MPRIETKPLVAVNTGRVLMVPLNVNWVSEIIVSNPSPATGERKLLP